MKATATIYNDDGSRTERKVTIEVTADEVSRIVEGDWSMFETFNEFEIIEDVVIHA
jgi:hypothetical protein